MLDLELKVVDTVADQYPTVLKNISAAVTREGEWYVAQYLNVDVASQGMTEDEALDNLREALELYFEDPTPTEAPHIAQVDVRIIAA